MEIGFFDSGLGGLLVLKAVAAKLPQYDYEYYGDTANLPYGDKTEDEIYELTKQGVEHLFARGCALVVIACNTASAETTRKLQDIYLKETHPDRRILGVIIPTVEEVVTSTTKNVLLVGTKRTIESQKYEKEFSKIHNTITVTSVATPKLVPLIEAGEFETAAEHLIAVIEKAGKYDGVILGCTHYGLLASALKKHFGTTLKIFAQEEIIPAKLQTYLHNHSEIEQQLSQGSTRTIHLTSSSPIYDHQIQTLLSGVFIAE